MNAVRALCVAAMAGAVLAVAAPVGAANECDGLMVCIPVAGPWVVVPASTGAQRERVEYQLTCPRGYIVGGTDARLSNRAIDVGFIGTTGSPVNPGITTSRSAVFLGTYVGRSASAPTFKPFIGCMPQAGGGSRVPTSVSQIRPGRPVTRRVKHRARPARDDDDHAALHRGRAPRRRNACVRVRDAHAAEREPRRERLGLAADLRWERCRPRERRCRARRRPRGRPGAGSVCEGVMSFQSPWMLLGLLVIAAFVGAVALGGAAPRTLRRRYTNLDVLATVVSGRSWLASCRRRSSCSVSARSSWVSRDHTSSARSCARRPR